MHLLCICLRPLPSNVNVPREFNTVTSQRDSAVATPMKIRLERRSCLNSGIGLSRLQFVEPHLVLVLSSLTVCFFVNKVLLECFFPHLLKYCVWLFLHNNSRPEWVWQKPYDLQREKRVALWPLTEKVWWPLVQGHSVTEEIKYFPNSASCLPPHDASEIQYSSHSGQA